jgi:hypothetical protein
MPRAGLLIRLKGESINRESGDLQTAQLGVRFKMVPRNSHSQPAKLEVSFVSRFEMVPETTVTHKMECQE